MFLFFGVRIILDTYWSIHNYTCVAEHDSPKEMSSVRSTTPAKAACLWVIRDGPATEADRVESSSLESSDSISREKITLRARE